MHEIKAGDSFWAQLRADIDKARADGVRTAEDAGFKLPTVQHERPIPANENPFWHDSFNMGTTLVRGWTIMHPGYDRTEDPQNLDYMILVNTRTGQRIRVDLTPCYPPEPEETHTTDSKGQS